VLQVISDEKWEILKPLLPQEPSRRKKGMPHTDFRCVFNTIFWILKTGARWIDVLAAKSTAHRWLQKWYKNGLLETMLIHLLGKAQEKELIDCQRLIFDSSFSPARMGGEKVEYAYKGKGSLFHLHDG